jgi:plastocyanin
VTFTLTVGPPAPYVVIVRSNSPKDVFLSAQNGTTNPAVDTLPAGATLEWRVEPWDYFLYYGRDLVPVGQPSFPQQTFPPDDPSTVSVTFTVPGTYHYADSWSPGGTGIIVVQ